MFESLRKRQESQEDFNPGTGLPVKSKGVVIPFPVSQVPNRLVTVEKQQSYEEVAQSLGFYPTELVREQLAGFFEREGYKLYDHKQVYTYMTAQKKKAGRDLWCWRPLREKDIIKEYTWGWAGNNWGDGYYSSSNRECIAYTRLVPQHALEKVLKIEKEFGDRVKFFVSDYADLNPDPFIMVRPTSMNQGSNEKYILIFDYWDEPGFGV